MDHQAINSIVVAFPTLASYLIVLLFGAGVASVLWAGKKILARLDEQDEALGDIRKAQISEIGKLREMSHAIELRVTVIEERCRISHGSHPAHIHMRREDVNRPGAGEG